MNEPNRSKIHNVPIRFIEVNTFLVHHSHMKQTDPQYKLRIPPDLKEQIENAAKANNRSMNAEIVARLGSPKQDQSALIEVIARLNLELARAEVRIQHKDMEKAQIETKLRAAVRLLGRTQYAHDPNFEILAAQSEESLDERDLFDGWIEKIDVAMKKYSTAISELEKIKSTNTSDS